MSESAERRVLLVVSGGIAAYKACDVGSGAASRGGDGAGRDDPGRRRGS